MNTKARINASHDGLTRDSTVLLLVDYQVGPLWEPDAMALRRDIVAFAGVVNSLGVPTVLTAMSCDDWGPIIPELNHVMPGAPVIQRSILDPWSVPRIREAVEETGRTHVVIAGVATEMCVACAALGAAHDGYSVHAVLDASGHFSPHAAAAAVVRMRAGGVIIASCAMVLLELVKDDLERGPSALLALSLRHALPQPPTASGASRRRRRTA